jgi:PAS domain-containing protein
MELDALLKATGAIGASVGSAYASWKWIWPWLKNDLWPVLVGFKAIAELPTVVHTCSGLNDTIKAHDIRLARVMKEVLPNGGSSLRDAVGRIETSVSDQAQYLRVMAGTMRANLDSDPYRALFETDADGSNLWVNKTYLRWVNRSVQEMLGWGWLACVADADRERVRDEWLSCVKERRQFQARYFLVDSAGARIEVDCHVVPIPEGASVVERYVGVIRRVDRRVYEDQE